MLRPTITRLSEAFKSGQTFTVHNNPYKAQKEWPPDFSKLPQKYQFNLERRYKRRSKLKWARPGWNKGVKVTSYVVCGFTFVYGVLFMDWENEFGKNQKPFEDIRDAFFGTLDSMWTTSSRPLPDSGDVSRRDQTSK